ncbi:AN1-type zinc finger protein 1 [Dinochytrium kinnereticum]|nr:AN1-type zinc finger protein 1 [Dinochytrium kinnereticum]
MHKLWKGLLPKVDYRFYLIFNEAIRHRHAPDHDCERVKKQEEAAASNRTNIKEFLNQRFPSNSQQKSTAAPPLPARKVAKLNPKIELMKMKSKAKGESSVPQESRIYLRVYLPQPEAKEESVPFFFHKDWTVGRIVDKVAASVGMENVNNKSIPERMLSLHPVNGDDGPSPAFPMSSTLSELISSSGGALQSGSCIALWRGAAK